MKDNLEQQLLKALARLSQLSEKVKKTSPKEQDQLSVRLLEELLKEQIQSENSRSSTHAVR